MKLRRLSFVLVAVVVGLAGWASSTPALTVDDVLDLLDAGIGEDVILEQMDADGSVFHLSADDILDLKDAGASDDLISFMIAAGQDGDSRDSYQQYRYDEYDQYDYRPSSVVSIYYDPFGYYWYPCHYYYTYWAPFSWFDYGFYWGAPVYWGWAHWGHRYDYYAHSLGYYWYPYRYYDRHNARHEGRRLWSRTRGHDRDRYFVSRKTPRSSRVSYTRGSSDRYKTTRQGVWSRSSKTARGRYSLSKSRVPITRSRSWTRSGRTRGTPKAPRSAVGRSRSTSSRGSKKATRPAPKVRSGSSRSKSSGWKAPSRSPSRSSSKPARSPSSGKRAGSKSPKGR